MLAREGALQNRVVFRRRRATAERDHFHAERVCQARGFPSDAAIADDAKRLIAQESDVELLPARGFLLANQAAQIFREEEHGGDGEFGQRGAENAPAVGQRDGACDQFGRQNLFDAGRQSVDPLHTLGQRQDRAQRGAIVEAVEDHVGFRSVLFQEIEIVAGVTVTGCGRRSRKRRNG